MKTILTLLVTLITTSALAAEIQGSGLDGNGRSCGMRNDSMSMAQAFCDALNDSVDPKSSRYRYQTMEEQAGGDRNNPFKVKNEDSEEEFSFKGKKLKYKKRF